MAKVLIYTRALEETLTFLALFLVMVWLLIIG